MCSPRKSDENFSILTFYESKQTSLTQDLKWSLNNVVRYKYSLSPASNWFVTLYYIIASSIEVTFQNMAVGDLAFYYTLYLWPIHYYNQGFWTYLYFRIRHSFAHVWTILNKMAAFGVIAHVRTILNKMASFCVNIYRSSASEHGQNITNVTTI